MKTYEQTIEEIAERTEFVNILYCDICKSDEAYELWKSETDALEGMHILAASIYEVALSKVICDVFKLLK